MSSWHAEAACQGKPQRWWFPNSRDAAGALNKERAKEVCGSCPVREECLQFAITTHQEHGIWGGFDPDERKRQRRFRVIYCSDCGRRFTWIPGEPTDRPPRYCSAHCKNEARKKTRSDSRRRRLTA